MRRKEDAFIKYAGKNKYMFRDISSSFKYVSPSLFGTTMVLIVNQEYPASKLLSQVQHHALCRPFDLWRSSKDYTTSRIPTTISFVKKKIHTCPIAVLNLIPSQFKILSQLLFSSQFDSSLKLPLPAGCF